MSCRWRGGVSSPRGVVSLGGGERVPEKRRCAKRGTDAQAGGAAQDGRPLYTLYISTARRCRAETIGHSTLCTTP